MNRRNFVSLLSQLLVFLPFGGTFGAFLKSADKSLTAEAVTGQRYAMGIQISECIGCGRCVVACKTENNVPRKPFFFRTWVERYIIKKDDEVIVQSKDGGVGAFTETVKEKDILRSFFVPKLCNHCDNPPCAQVCPVGATFQTVEGIVLVDENRCIGCSYCIQACPYGARYMHPEKHTADKCTLCYHRIRS